MLASIDHGASHLPFMISLWTNYSYPVLPSDGINEWSTAARTYLRGPVASWEVCENRDEIFMKFCTPFWSMALPQRLYCTCRKQDQGYACWVLLWVHTEGQWKVDYNSWIWERLCICKVYELWVSQLHTLRSRMLINWLTVGSNDFNAIWYMRETTEKSIATCSDYTLYLLESCLFTIYDNRILA